MENSNFFSLKTQDFIKGFVVSFITAVLTVICQTLQAGEMVFDWTSILTVGGSAAAAYLLKNLNTNSEGRLLKKE